MLLDRSRTLSLQTRLGRDIENVQEMEYTAHQQKMQEGLLRQAQPTVVAASVRRREASSIYNCHGLTFASRRTGITEERVVNMILADDGYREISLKRALPGDIVLYYSEQGLAHSGVVVQVPGTGFLAPVRVVSKWGRGAEYIHDILIHPYPDVTQVKCFRETDNAR